MRAQTILRPESCEIRLYRSEVRLITVRHPLSVCSAAAPVKESRQRCHLAGNVAVI
jgi:hypothetical protein